MTPDSIDLDNLRRLVSGWIEGTFLTNDDGDLAFDPNNGGADDEDVTAIDDIDDGPEMVATMLNALPALLADHARLTERQQELLQTIRNLSASVPYPEEQGAASVLIAEVGTLRSALTAKDAELTAERDAHHATCDALARERAEVANLRGSVESYMAMLDDANVDRSAALVRAERIEAESDAELARLREGLEVQHMAEANRIAGANGCCGGCDAAWLTEEVARTEELRANAFAHATAMEEERDANRAEWDAAHEEAVTLRAEVERLEQELVEAQGRESTAQEIHNESAAQWHAEVARLAAFIENDVTRRRTVIEAVASMPAVDAELDAARAEVARLRGLALRVGKWIRACIDTDHHTDQACAECVPGGPIVIPGFACVVHSICKEAAGE